MGPLMVSFPYNSHIFKDSYGSGTGIVWGPRGPTSLGVPEIPLNETAISTICPKRLHMSEIIMSLGC